MYNKYIQRCHNETVFYPVTYCICYKYGNVLKWNISQEKNKSIAYCFINHFWTVPLPCILCLYDVFCIFSGMTVLRHKEETEKT